MLVQKYHKLALTGTKEVGNLPSFIIHLTIHIHPWRNIHPNQAIYTPKPYPFTELNIIPLLNLSGHPNFVMILVYAKTLIKRYNSHEPQAV